jgi:general L-amino acid transport system permease protein
VHSGIGRSLAKRSTEVLRATFASPLNAVLTIVAVAGAIGILAPLIRWALIDATWSGSAADCRANQHGACWAFIGDRLHFILFGLYPAAERWRPALATASLITLVAFTAAPRFWKRWLTIVWLAGLGILFWVMGGGAGLPTVPPRLWGGLPVTLMLTTIGLALAFPLGVMLALGRRSSLAVPRLAATTVVEVVRGVPMIAVLYVAALVVPLALPRGFQLDKLLLALVAVTMFASAYLAEAVRAGLQDIPAGQRAAALALGLTRWQAMRLVILPQALRVMIPSFTSIAIGFFQDTSLVVIIGLFDLLNTARLAAQDSAWLGFHTEAYVFAAIIYVAGSAAIARYSSWLERRVGHARSMADPKARMVAII